MNPIEEKIAKELGIDNSKPFATFYDHAVPDPERTEQQGRACFKEKVYIRKVPTAPDLVVRNTFSRPMEESDKREFADAWKRYTERKQAIANLDPLVTAIPGCGVAQKAELEELEIFTCGQFADYPKPLGDLEPLRLIAKRIREVAKAVEHGEPQPIQPPKFVQDGQTFHYEFSA